MYVQKYFFKLFFDDMICREWLSIMGGENS